MRTAKEIFDEELSGEPLSEDVVINAIKIAQQETVLAILKIENILDIIKKLKD